MQVGNGFSARAAKAGTKKEALAIHEEGFEALRVLFTKNKGIIDDLRYITKQLKQLPYVDTSVPTLALVGAPNVGKSSLVQALSSGRPEICNYPFTTKNIKMGHFFVDGVRHQVTDTPGLLNRPDADRNAMEMLTVASLEYLPTAVVFVMDLTEECGTNVRDQLSIRNELKQRYGSKVWIDVMSKGDVIQDILDESEQRKRDKQVTLELPKMDAADVAAQVDGALIVSALTGAGMEEMKVTVMNKLADLQLEEDNSTGFEEEGEEEAV